VSALTMPLRELARTVRGESSAARWRFVARQWLLAVGILVAMWLTGKAIVALVVRVGVGVGSSGIGRGITSRNVLQVSALALSLGTLSLVWLVMHALRILVRWRSRIPHAAIARRIARDGTTWLPLVIAFALALATARPLTAQQSAQAGSAVIRTRTAAADAAFAAGDRAVAEREYAAVLQSSPDDSRALYMLAQLRRDRVHEAVALLHRYVRLEPSDAWGHMALGDALGRVGDVSSASGEYNAAARLAPDERDVAVGRARMLARAGYTDSAIVVYRRWLEGHARDAEAQRELARQYHRAGRDRAAIAAFERAQRAAPDDRTARQLASLRSGVSLRVEPEAGGNRDSDANAVWRLGGVAGFSVADGVDLTAGGGTRRVTDALSMAQLGDARIGVAWRPRATMRLEAATSLTFAPGDTSNATPSPQPGPGQGQGPGSPPGGGRRASVDTRRVEPVGRLRFVWQDPASRARVDLRASRTVLDASPLLVFNNVVRSEIGGEGNVRVLGPLGLRGTARAASIASNTDDNSRTILAGRVVVAGPSWGEITAGMQQTAYTHASAAGYFAPHWARTAEIGAYREFESERGVTAAVDLGAGAQQVGEWDGTSSKWDPAFRGWASLGVPLAPGRELRFEMEGYQAKVGNEVATTASRWSYISASLGLRWAVR